MKRKDIEVGRKYKNAAHPGAIYLGVGKWVLGVGRDNYFVRKNFVIITGRFAGYIYQLSGANCHWDSFRPLDKH